MVYYPDLKVPISIENKSTLYLFNEIFKIILIKASWIIYLFCVGIAASCIYFYFKDRQRKEAITRRRREIRRSNEKPPQKRRPGAVARDREILRNIMGQIQDVIDPNRKEIFIFRHTQSGKIYGQLEERELNNIQEKHPLKNE